MFFFRRMIERNQALVSMAVVSLLVFSGLAIFSHALNLTLRGGIDEELINIATQTRQNRWLAVIALLLAALIALIVR